MNRKPFDPRILFQNVERCKSHRGFDTGEISTSLVVSDFVNRLSCGRSSRICCRLRKWSLYSPVGLVKGLEVFEEILEKVDTGGELDIDVTIVFENEPGNVGNDEFVFLMAPPVFEIPCMCRFQYDTQSAKNKAYHDH
jgi:hypothetical protein